jgi:nucleoside phosphorylase
VDIEPTDIAILAPTAWEWNEMLEHLSDRVSVDGPLPMEQGSIGSFSVLCCSSGKGQEKTASALTLIIERATPKWLFLVGIAGGFPAQKVHRGDVVVAHVIHSFDYGKLVAGTFKRRPEDDFICDRSLLSWAEVVAADRQGHWRSHLQAKRPDGEDREASVAHVDCYIASSNKLVDDPDHVFFSAVAATFPEIHAVEMEGVGAGASARLAQSERGVGLLMIRGISDEPGTAAAQGTAQRSEWKTYAAAAAAAFVRTLIDRLPAKKKT